MRQPAVSWGDPRRFDGLTAGWDRKYVRSFQFRVARQVSGYPSLPSMTLEQLRKMEKEMMSAFQALLKDNPDDEEELEGLYNSITDLERVGRIKARGQ